MSNESNAPMRATVDVRRVAGHGRSVVTTYRDWAILVIRRRSGAIVAVGSAFVVTRFVIALLIFLSSIVIPLSHQPGLFRVARYDIILDGLIRWDSGWYLRIALNGYTLHSGIPGQASVAFFPLYPLLVAALFHAVGHLYIVAVAVSNAALLAALGYLYALARYEYGDRVAARAVWYLAAAPGAVFFSAAYSESVFMAFTVAAFYHARKGQWLRAGLAGALAAATRNTGVLLLAVIALEGLQQQGLRIVPGAWSGEGVWRHVREQGRRARRAVRSLVAAAFVPLGLVAFMAYLGLAFGDPLAFVHQEQGWQRNVSVARLFSLGAQVQQDLHLGPRFWAGQVDAQTLIDLIVAVLFLPLVAATVFKMRPSYAVFAVLTFLIPLSSGAGVLSMTRYMLMLVPCFMLLAHWARREWLHNAVLGVFLPLMAYVAITFSHWYPPY